MSDGTEASQLPWSREVISIGRVHSPFAAATGTPVQNFAARSRGNARPSPDPIIEGPVVDGRGGRGTLEIAPAWESALADLDGCDRIWLLFWADRASAPLAKIVPYRDTRERGLFSTRAPARPNPIGLSCVRLLGIRGRFVHVEELDLLDGTPLLDIKPYVAQYDSFPEAALGWLGEPTVIPGAMWADARFESPGGEGLTPPRG